VDGHENLLLLCSEHHKQVDDQVEYFTVEQLHEIKKTHKEWISSLGTPDPGPVKLVPDPNFPKPRALKLLLTGNDLWNMLIEAKALWAPMEGPSRLPPIRVARKMLLAVKARAEGTGAVLVAVLDAIPRRTDPSRAGPQGRAVQVEPIGMGQIRAANAALPPQDRRAG
jgi:hypothetical protein